MQDADLFLELAGIAGVFIGFGALIAVRSAGAPSTLDIVSVGMVVFLATIVAAMSLAPVAISRFGMGGHGLWLVCSVGALLLWWVGDEVILRTSRDRRRYMAEAPLRARWRGELIAAAIWLPANVALVLVLVGVFPDQEAALYFAAASLFLLMDALMLLMMVFRVGFPEPADTPPEASTGESAGGGRPLEPTGARVAPGSPHRPAGRDVV